MDTRLTFTGARRASNPAESVTVRDVLPDGLIAERNDGSEVRLTKKQRHAFDVAELAPLEVAAGRRASLPRGIAPDIGVHNGERQKVASVEGGRVQLANGEILPEGFTQVCHGHAVTSHKSQGCERSGIDARAGTRLSG